jgi:hypothetical protein
MTAADSVLNSSENVSTAPGDELGQAILLVLRQLEASLEASQAAVLAREVEGIERHTEEQMRLSRALTILYGESTFHAHQQHHPASDFPAALPRMTTRLAADLRAAEKRVLQLTRVQAALLGRAQRFLRILTNLVAGPGASYGPGPLQSGPPAEIAGR